MTKNVSKTISWIKKETTEDVMLAYWISMYSQVLTGRGKIVEYLAGSIFNMTNGQVMQWPHFVHCIYK